MNEALDRRRATYQLLLAALWLTLLVLVIKVWAGWATQSLSLLAESLHTLINSFSIFLSLVVVASPGRITGRDLWSHSRSEAIGALVLAALLGFSGIGLIAIALQQVMIAIQGLDDPFAVSVSAPLLQLLAVVIIINFCLLLFERYEARVLASPILRLNANTILQESWLTLLMLFGLTGVLAGYGWLDPILGTFLVIMSVRRYWQVLNRQLPLLLQSVAIAPETLAQLACQVEGVTHCYNIRTRGIVGRYLVVQMQVTVHPEFMGSASVIAEWIEGLIRERYGPVQAMIHVSDKLPQPVAPPARWTWGSPTLLRHRSNGKPFRVR